jgi:tetratricopeptide (TPR) repeat protein
MTTRRVPSYYLVLSACTLAWMSVEVHADERSRAARQADALVSQGVALRRAGDDEGALVLFTRAYELDPDARILAQRALAEQALARFVEAEEHLAEALEDDDHPWIELHRVSLEESLATIRASLPREPEVVTPPPPTPVREPARPARERGRQTPTPEARSRVTEHVLLGTGGGFLAASVISLTIRAHNARAFNDDEACLVGDATRGETCGEHRTRAVRAQRAAGITFGVGSSLVTTAVLLYVLRPDEEEASRASFVPRCAAAIADGVEGTCAWRF